MKKLKKTKKAYCANNHALLKYLTARFNQNPISRSTLAMACHYFLRDNCEPSSNQVDKIEEKIENLIGCGLLQKLTDGTLKINDNKISI